MRFPRTVAVAFVLVIAFGVSAGSLQATPGIQGKKAVAKTETGSSIPKEVIAMIQEGLVTRQGRQDIPFNIFKHLTLPAQGVNMYPIFFFKAKNGELGYAPSATGSGEMETTLNVFFEFFRIGEDGTPRPAFGGKTQAVLRTDGAGYSADEEDWYSLGLAMPSGKYTLALALTTPDMKKMSVGYNDFTLPGPEAYQEILWATDPVVVKVMDQVEPDARPTIHRRQFTWGAVRFASNEARQIGAGENIEIFFFVLGAAVKDPASPRPANDIEVLFEVQQEGGDAVIKWAPQSYESYFINQLLPLKQTLQQVDESGKVLSTEQKPLGAGQYVLSIMIEDKISGKKGEAKMPFEVK